MVDRIEKLGEFGGDKPSQLPAEKPQRPGAHPDNELPDQERPERPTRPEKPETKPTPERPKHERPPEPTPMNPTPRDGYSISGAMPDPLGEDKGGDSPEQLPDQPSNKEATSGVKSLHAKQVVAEQKTAEAKAYDVEDMREETSGYERFDNVTGKELNIPPSIIQERLKNNQNPSTGQGWSQEERRNYNKAVEQERQQHAKAVKESEDRMRKEEAEKNTTQRQPTSHVPDAFLTDRQREEMQKVQDSGGGPVAQARARDANSPEELGRSEAENQ